jgi:hypothetical protein
MNDRDELKQVIHVIQTQLPPIVPCFLLKIMTIGVDFSDAKLIRLAPECHDTGGVACLYHGTFGRSAYS